jgi:hypothetical protein
VNDLVALQYHDGIWMVKESVYNHSGDWWRIIPFDEDARKQKMIAIEVHAERLIHIGQALVI